MDSFASERDERIEAMFVGRTKELDHLRATLTKPVQRAAVVQGVRGSGKTALLMMFHHQSRDLFPGGYESTYGFGPQSPVDVVRDRMRLPLRDRALLVIDDAHMMATQVQAELGTLFRANPQLRLLMATAEPLPEVIGPAETLDLAGLSQAEYYDLLSRRVAHVDAGLVRRLWASTQGHVLAGDLAGRTIRQNLLTWNELLQALEGATRSAIFGPDGQPIPPSGAVPSTIVVAVSEVNEELLSMLRQDPRNLYSLSPRKFEEVVAELLSRLGYSVDLTPTSADGGFDMYAARKDGLGRFPYLVECKRYAPSQKVGVQIVRSLYGVVQQKRANAGIIATTSFFTKGAKELQQQLEYQMHLQDYLTLQEWLK